MEGYVGGFGGQPGSVAMALVHIPFARKQLAAPLSSLGTGKYGSTESPGHIKLG